MEGSEVFVERGGNSTGSPSSRPTGKERKARSGYLASSFTYFC